MSLAQQLIPNMNAAAGASAAGAGVGSKLGAGASAGASPPGPGFQAPAGAAAAAKPTVSDEVKRFEEFKKSPMYVEPFDAKVLSLPTMQLSFVRDITKKDIVFYKEILNEAISMRNKMAASVRLMLKYSGRLMSSFIKHRREEKKLPQRVEAKPEFFQMLADLCQEVIDTSGQLKRNYSKSKIDVDNFRSRVETLFDTVQQIIETSPMGGYLRWNQLVLYKDKPRNGVANRRFIEETADLTAVSFLGMRSSQQIFRLRI